MRKCVILIITALSSCVYAASEIQSFVAGASTAFAVVREKDGDVWYVSGQVFEAWGTGARTAADYDIALTDKSGDMFVGNFDTNISAGYYHIITYQQEGGSPADTDPAVWQEYGYWDGDEWLKGATAQDVNDLTLDTSDVNDAVWTALCSDFNTDGTFGALVQDTNDNATLILADTNELQTDWKDGGRLDVILDAIKYKTDLLTLLDTTVDTPNDANTFTLTDGPDSNDVYRYHVVMVEDADDSHYEMRYITSWKYDTDVTIKVNKSFTFTPAAGDVVHIIGTDYEAILFYMLINSAPIYRFDYTSGSGTSAGSGITYYDHTGEDP